MSLYVRLTLVLLLGASAPGIQAEVPIVDATSTGESDYRQATAAPAGVASGPMVGSSSANSAGLLYQLELLQVEVQELRGLVEQQAHQIQQMREEQRDRYLDLDRRITLLNKAGNSGVSPVGPVSPANPPSTIGPVPQADEKSSYQAAIDLVRGKRYEEAADAFSSFIQTFPDGSYTGNAYYWLGEVLVVKGDQQGALTAFGALLERFPQHRKEPDAKYKMGRLYRELGDSAKARNLLEEVVTGYPGSSAAKLAEAELRSLVP